MSQAKSKQAVALKYNQEQDMAPIVIASGYGEVAERIIDIAQYFHVSVDYLLGLDNRLTIDISSLNEKEKTMIYNLIEIFINSQK